MRRTAAARDERFGSARRPLSARSTRPRAELLNDCEQDRTLRAVLVVGMLREGDHTSRQAGRHKQHRHSPRRESRRRGLGAQPQTHLSRLVSNVMNTPSWSIRKCVMSLKIATSPVPGSTMVIKSVELKIPPDGGNTVPKPKLTW